MGEKDLPLARGQDHVRVFQSFGWTVRRSEKNHFVLTNFNHRNVILSIPDHKEVDRRTLKAEPRKAGLTVEEYRKRFDKF